jgi:hypothetical protein
MSMPIQSGAEMPVNQIVTPMFPTSQEVQTGKGKTQGDDTQSSGQYCLSQNYTQRDNKYTLSCSLP